MSWERCSPERACLFKCRPTGIPRMYDSRSARYRPRAACTDFAKYYGFPGEPKLPNPCRPARAIRWVKPFDSRIPFDVVGIQIDCRNPLE